MARLPSDTYCKNIFEMKLAGKCTVKAYTNKELNFRVLYNTKNKPHSAPKSEEGWRDGQILLLQPKACYSLNKHSLIASMSVTIKYSWKLAKLLRPPFKRSREELLAGRVNYTPRLGCYVWDAHSIHNKLTASVSGATDNSGEGSWIVLSRVAGSLLFPPPPPPPPSPLSFIGFGLGPPSSH